MWGISATSARKTGLSTPPLFQSPSPPGAFNIWLFAYHPLISMNSHLSYSIYFMRMDTRGPLIVGFGGVSVCWNPTVHTYSVFNWHVIRINSRKSPLKSGYSTFMEKIQSQCIICNLQTKLIYCKSNWMLRLSGSQATRILIVSQTIEKHK